MEIMRNKSIAERLAKTSYQNFNVAIYCPADVIKNITDFDDFDRRFKLVSDHVKIGRAYIECYRAMDWCEKEQILRVKEYFESKGIATSGGIMTCGDCTDGGWISLCYSKPEGREILRKSVALNAEIFDEFIFDDFLFLNCRCEECVKQKGGRSWPQFRLDQKKEIAEEIIMKTAKEINPDVNVILKYPQWYEVFDEEGFDLKLEPELFDSIYTGTETRNPTYAQQHIPKYLSYFIMRYLESTAPGRNLGGWFDPYECTYSLTSYLEQCYLTLFAKPKEVTLFGLGVLVFDSEYRLFAPAVGELFAEVDEYLGKLGNPGGVAAYRPAYARGEDNIHNYLGMCGIPFEAYINYPEKEKVIFLSEGAADDADIVSRMKKSMLEGASVIVTSGFVRKLGDAFGEFVNVKYSSRKAIINEYAVSKNSGVTVGGKYTGAEPVMIPQLDYCTNDIWELAAGYGTDNNFPIVLRCRYGEGSISIITIPDSLGDIYHYPVPVLNVIRSLFSKEIPVTIEGPAQVQLFAYKKSRDNGSGSDNDEIDNSSNVIEHVIVRSDLPYAESFTLKLSDRVKAVEDIVKGIELPIVEGKITLQLAPCVNYVLELK